MRCDFCNAENPQWSCPCGDSISVAYSKDSGRKLYSQNNVGEWLACDDCVRHVAAKSPRELAKHCTRKWFARRDQPAPLEHSVEFQELLRIIEGMQTAYWKNAVGLPTISAHN